MKKFETRQVTVDRYVLTEWRCDGCGRLQEEAEFGSLIAVAIEVSHGEEYGRRDEYDFCNPCLIERADTLVAAGSRSALVTGVEPVDDEDDDDRSD